ncbi:hypothetical protein C5167_033509 [Papaver somniferum]|uniref:Uncharacterized protein n=1 Tax=Papaver somniferum TaxID=3469 RepID=A0A4Y7KAJ3_PAPSO|nr:hypothetical protein C5167_033509 [Papaver somniferum]
MSEYSCPYIFPVVIYWKRYMATSDLLNELSKDGYKADHDLELKISMTVQ